MILHLESVKKSINERAQAIIREITTWVNDRVTQVIEGKVDSSKALDAGLVVTESNETESERHVSSSRSGKDTHDEDAVINSVNDKQPLAEVQLTVQHDTLANEQQHFMQSEPIYDTHLLERFKTVENADLKAHIQEKVFANVALKNELQKLKGNNVDTKFVKPSILGKPVLQPPRNLSVVRQPNAFKSERPNFSKPRFASQVDVINVLNSQEEPYGSSVMAHNHYLEEARKKTQERNRNSRPSVMHTTSLQNTANGHMAPVQLTTGSAPTFLTPGQISSGLVPNPILAAPYVPPTNKDLEILFQPMFDEYLEPPRIERPVSPAPAVQVPVNSTGTPSSTTIDKDAHSPSHLPSSSALQSPSLHQGVTAESPLMEDNPFAPIDNDHFINVFAPEPRSEASSSRDLSSTEYPYVSQTLYHFGKWSKDHPLDNIIGNPSRPISTRKQLTTDALWCLDNSVLSKVEPKNFKSAITED
ncbi:hypothetical protein Tco_0815312, partial [Tanacetum coccineum]